MVVKYTQIPYDTCSPVKGKIKFRSIVIHNNHLFQPFSPLSPASTPSLRPIMTLPMTSIPAPTSHRPLSSSPNTVHPANAVKRKLADVLIIETRVVEDPRVKAIVNSVHIKALNRMFKRRHSYEKFLKISDDRHFEIEGSQNRRIKNRTQFFF